MLSGPINSKVFERLYFFHKYKIWKYKETYKQFRKYKITNCQVNNVLTHICNCFLKKHVVENNYKK